MRKLIERLKPYLYYLPLIIFIILVLALFFILNKEPARDFHFSEEKNLPVFEAKDLYGNQVLSEDLLSYCPFLLNVWSTWCPTCYVEHPFLMELKSQAIPIVGVLYKDSPEKAKAYLKKKGDPYVLNIIDSRGMLAIQLGVYGTPETYLVDCEGQLRTKHIGVMTESVWKSWQNIFYKGS